MRDRAIQSFPHSFIHQIFAECQQSIRHRIPERAIAELKRESKDLVLTWLSLTCIVTIEELLKCVGLNCLFDQKK